MLRDMPAGEYRLHVSKSGFVPFEYGQRRPLEAPKRIVLKEGARVTANIALPRGAAITGRVIDEAGEPVAGVRVQALRSRTIGGQPRLQPVGAADVSDDTGVFRVHGLPPGEYYLTAVPPETHLPQMPRGAIPAEMPPGSTVARIAARMAVYFPGTADIQEALRLSVGGGGEARADLQLGATNAATVSGIVLTSTGGPAADATITLRSEIVAASVVTLQGGPVTVYGFSVSGHAEADGTFELRDVPPGPYRLNVSTGPMQFRTIQTPNGQMPVGTPEMAEMGVTVAAGGLTGLTITTGEGNTIEATLVADAGVTRPLPRGAVVEARGASPGGAHLAMINTVNPTTFRQIVSGPAYLQVSGLPEDWMVKSMLLDGVDVSDRPIAAKGGVANVRVVLTDRVTEVTGAVPPPTAPRDDVPAYSIVVFPADATKWTYPSRFVRTVRTDDQGRFRMTGLPGNERYLAIAVDYLEDGEESDPEFLQRIQGRASPFTLGDAERKAITVPLVQR